ncbi:hypothetical protein [Pseudomonas sp. KU43P]|nr:hypothetical protein [Pseudomonas sp. KU43P]
MNLSWFDDWRFDMRRWLAFHEHFGFTGKFPAAKAPIIGDQRVPLHGK